MAPARDPSAAWPRFDRGLGACFVAFFGVSACLGWRLTALTGTAASSPPGGALVAFFEDLGGRDAGGFFLDGSGGGIAPECRPSTSQVRPASTLDYVHSPGWGNEKCSARRQRSSRRPRQPHNNTTISHPILLRTTHSAHRPIRQPDLSSHTAAPPGGFGPTRRTLHLHEPGVVRPAATRSVSVLSRSIDL